MIFYLQSSADTRLYPLFFFHCSMCARTPWDCEDCESFKSHSAPYHSTTTDHTGRAKATYQLKRRRKAHTKTNPTSEGRGLLLLDKQNLPYTGTKMSTFNNIYPPLSNAPRKASRVG